MRSYDYGHRDGVDRVIWERFYTLARTMAEQLAERRIDAVLGIARAGLFPATAIACALRCDLHPIRLSRRENDRVVRPSPAWYVPVPDAIAGKRVALVDEMADTGETLRIAAHAARARGATEVVTAALIAHTWADPMPEVVGELTDALVVFPWDAEVLIDGTWRAHPELEPYLEDGRPEHP